MNTRSKAGKIITQKQGLALRLALCSLFVIGAGTTLRTQAAEETKPTAVVRLSQLNNEVSMLRANLARTIASLQEVRTTANNNGALAKPYESFNSELAALEAQVTTLREQGTAARARVKEHYDEWQKELTSMQNAQLREKAQNRFTAASKQFDKIIDRVDAAKKVFAPLMADLKDINVYLKTDLSNDAVSSLSGNIWKLSNTAQSVDRKLADVNEQIEKTLKKMPQSSA